MKSQRFNLLTAHRDFEILALFSLANNERFYADARISTILYLRGLRGLGVHKYFDCIIKMSSHIWVVLLLLALQNVFQFL